MKLVVQELTVHAPAQVLYELLTDPVLFVQWMAKPHPSRLIVSQYQGSGVRSVGGASTCMQASDAATSSSASRSPTGTGVMSSHS